MTASALRAVREVRSTRAGRPTRGDLANALYLTVILMIVIGAPLIRAAADGLGRPAVLGALPGASAATATQTAVGLLLGAAVLVGRVRGPAITSPFLTVAVSGNSLPRRVTLRRPYTISATVALLAARVAELGGLRRTHSRLVGATD